MVGKIGEYYIDFSKSVKDLGKYFALNFGYDLPAGLASRLSSCTYIRYRYRYACTATKTLASF